MHKLILNSQNTAQMVVDYINASNQVCSYAMSIHTTQLPALVTPPANYGNFVQTFAQANEDVMGWINEVVPDFNLLPTAFINYNTLFQQQISTVQDLLQQLKAQPSNPAILASIQSALNLLVTEASATATTINGLEAAIADYQALIAPDATKLNDLCTQIAVAENADQNAIAQLNGVLANLQDVVDDRNILVTLNILANINEGIFIAMIGVALGVVFTGAAGVIVGIGFGIGSAVFTTLEPVGKDIDYQETLQDIQTDMNNVNTEIGLMNTTIGLLQNLNTQFANIVAQSSTAQTNIQTVLTFWKQIQADAQQIITDLSKTMSDSDIDQAISDLDTATTAWNSIEGYMQSIVSITYNIDPTVTLAASVQEMTNAQVKQMN